jgi:hypothetical protein
LCWFSSEYSVSWNDNKTGEDTGPESKEGEAVPEEISRLNWRGREEKQFGSAPSSMQLLHAPDLDLHVGDRIFLLVGVGMDET